MSRVVAAVVSLHSVRIGVLECLGEDEDHRFTFDREWLDDPDRPTLGQLFEDRQPDPIVTSGLPCWFAHLLPQGPWGRHLQRWAGLDDEASELELLLAIGDDLPGAVVLEPAVPALFGPGGYARPPVSEPSALRFGLAGAQWKLSVHRGERGLVVPVVGQGPGHFIAKFHDPSFASLPRVEFATTRWAELAGVHTHHVHLITVDAFDTLPEGVPTGDGTVFLAERFDRVEGARVHFEDFGQVIDRPPGHPGQYTGSYEELLELARVLCPEDLDEVLKRVAFVLVSGNADAHLKNWGLLYADRRTPRLSPAYDLVSTVVYPRLDEELALSLGGQRSFYEVDATAFDSMAAAMDLDASEVRRRFSAHTERARDTWTQARQEGWAPGEVERIEAHLTRLRIPTHL